MDQGRARFSYMGGIGGSLWKQMSFRLSNQRFGTANSSTKSFSRKSFLFMSFGVFLFILDEVVVPYFQ